MALSCYGVWTSLTSFGARLVQDSETALTAADGVASFDNVLRPTVTTSIFDPLSHHGNSRLGGRRARPNSATCIRHDDDNDNNKKSGAVGQEWGELWQSSRSANASESI